MSIRQLRKLAAWLGPITATCLASSGCWAQGCAVAPTTITHSSGFVPATAETVILDPAAHPRALCNDGTPGAYLIRPGFGVASSRWVIWLHGGGFCINQASCAIRANSEKTTSRFYAAGESVGVGDGIQSDNPTHNPDFYDANLVVVAYCSSDAWTGGTDGNPNYPPADVRSWHFRGRAIVEAVITDLIRDHGLASGREVLFGGGSAGGMGVFETLNDVAALLPGGVRLLGASDAGYAIDVEPYDPSSPGGVGSMQPTLDDRVLALGSALWKGRGDANCSAMANSWQARRNCYFPQYLSHGRDITTPVFIRQSDDDHVQLAYNGVLPNRAHPHSALYEQYFASQMVASLSAVTASYSTYSTDDFYHVMMDNPDFYSVAAAFDAASGGTFTTTVDQQLGAWYRRPCSSTQNIQSLPQ